MRVCFVVHQSTKEGAGRYMLDQAAYLLAHGIGVVAILPGDGPLCDALRELGIAVRTIASPWWTRTPVRLEPDYNLIVDAARRMVEAFREWRVDLVYTQTVVAPAGPIAAALAGIPHAWHIHEFSYNPGGIEIGIPHETLARLIDLTSNVVFFNSKSVAAEWTDVFDPRKTAVVYNWTTHHLTDAPVDTQDERSLALLRDTSVLRVAVIGSLVRWKRQRDAIEAIVALLREGVPATLLVVGPAVDPGYAAELERLVHDSGTTNSIRFLGYTEHPERVMRQVDVTLVCSDKEPFGRVTVESMAQGTTVVGSNSGGTAEIIEHGVDGLLFPTGDVAALTDALRQLARDDGMRHRFALAAREKAKRFQDADAAMAPVVDRLAALAGQRNPAWPLGTVFDSAFAKAPTRGSIATTTVSLAARVLSALRQRLRLGWLNR